MFNEVWRRYRDFFYVSNMHGYDWEKLRVQYAPLLEHIGHRSDLNYIIGEMISELNVGHAYIVGGDSEKIARPRVALPGARFELDKSRRIAIASRKFSPATTKSRSTVRRSPRSALTQRLAIMCWRSMASTCRRMTILTGCCAAKRTVPVRLTLSATPDRKAAREVVFQPISTETDLVYLEMVTRNRERVEKMTGGRVGYIHVPNMGAEGIREFIKYYYPQVGKEGMIVDVRANGGGNVSQMLIERLRRQLLATGFARTNDVAHHISRTSCSTGIWCVF